MDLSPIAGMQGRTPAGQSQAPNDFAEELKKSAPSKVTESSRDDGARAMPTRMDDDSADEALRDSAMSTANGGGDVLALSSPADTNALSVVGTVEQVLSARVFGLHLQASGYLSEYRLAPESGDGGDADIATHSFDLEEAAIQLASPEGADARGVPAEGCENRATETIVMSVSVAMSSRSEAPGAMEASALSLSEPDACRVIRWRERALRLFRRSDGKHVAWLRDYTLSKDDAGQLVAGLVQQLKGQGITLQSVMWNGHQIWPSVDIE